MTRRPGGTSVRSGFTLVELMFGVIFTCMVLGALTALLLAVTANWRDSQDRVFLPVANSTVPRYSALQRFDYVDSLVRNAKCLGWAGKKSSSADSAAVIWASDAVLPGTMQVSEVRVLEFNSAAKTLSMWYVPAGMSNSNSNSTLTLKFDDTNGQADVAAFKLVSNVQAQVLLRNVAVFSPKVVLNSADPQARPCLEYILQTQDGSQTARRYQTACLRAPGVQP